MSELINNAAMKLAQCMDYPWSHMPEKGRETMRSHAKLILDPVLKQRDDLLIQLKVMLQEALEDQEGSPSTVVLSDAKDLISRIEGHEA